MSTAESDSKPAIFSNATTVTKSSDPVVDPIENTSDVEDSGSEAGSDFDYPDTEEE